MKHRIRTHGKKPKESLKRVKQVAKKKWTVDDLVKAVRHRAWPVVIEALAAGVSPDGVHIQGDPLILAVTTIAPVRVVAAVLKAGADPDAVNRKRETPLFHATDPEIVKRLLKAGADPQHVSKAGTTALHVYAREGRASAMVPLVEGGAVIDLRDDEGRTPLVLAVESLRAAEAELLLKHGACPRAVAKTGESLLHIAARQRAKAAAALIDLLVGAGTKVDARSPGELTPLMVARSGDAVKALVRGGAQIDTTTTEGFTALHRAILAGEVTVAKTLLEARANLRLRVAQEHTDEQLAGKSAADLARQSPNAEIRALLK